MLRKHDLVDELKKWHSYPRGKENESSSKHKAFHDNKDTTMMGMMLLSCFEFFSFFNSFFN